MFSCESRNASRNTDRESPFSSSVVRTRPTPHAFALSSARRSGVQVDGRGHEYPESSTPVRPCSYVSAMRRHAGESTVPRSAHEAARVAVGHAIAHAAANAALQRANAALRDTDFSVTVLMAEMPYAGEHDRDPALVGGRDHLVVADAAARLDDSDGAVVGDDRETIAKRKERIGGHDRIRERQARLLRLQRGDACRVDAAHLPGADAERAAVAAIDDRVRLDEPCDAPREEQVGDLRVGRMRAGDGVAGGAV